MSVTAISQQLMIFRTTESLKIRFRQKAVHLVCAVRISADNPPVVVYAEGIGGQRRCSGKVHVDELRSDFSRGLHLVKFDVPGEPALGSSEADHIEVAVE